MTWARKQIQLCKEHHDGCGSYFMKEENKKTRPTRLIDVGREGDPYLRLVVTSELGTSATDYAALSYCWGDPVSCSEKICLRDDNLAAMKQPTDYSQWDKTYREAILITRALGIRYLRVDALCIIQQDKKDQGDKTDFKKEAPLMGIVYGNSACVLSIPASKDSKGGCFTDQTAFAGGCHLRRQRGASLDVACSRRQDTIMTNLFTKKVEQTRLSTRGWVFQEHILATRILHFRNGIVLFECNKLQASSAHGFGQTYHKRENLRVDGKIQRPVGPESPSQTSLPLFHLPALESPNNVFEMFDWSYEDEWAPNVSTRPFSRPARGGRMVTRTAVRWKPSFTYTNFIKFLDFPSLSGYFKDSEGYRRYFSSRTWLGESVESSRLGLRGAFETLVRFDGKSLEEKIEFHICWYELVEDYSSRGLTDRTDKLAAIEDLARFIPFEFVSELWRNAFEFNLLWAIASPNTSRPDSSIPTWSWASVDGRISHRLLTRPNSIAERNWLDLTLYVSISNIRNHSIIELSYQISLFRPMFSLTQFRFLLDIKDIHKDDEALRCLTVLSFRNSQRQPDKTRWELHGLILDSISTVGYRYKRIGYFWIADETLVEKVLITQKLRRFMEIELF